MYEREVLQQSDMGAKIAAAQRAQGYAGAGSIAADARPAGVLKAHTTHLREILNQIDGQRNRIYSLSERLLTPRPTPEPGNANKTNSVHHDTIEGDLEQLIAAATRLCSSFNEIADRLDSAV